MPFYLQMPRRRFLRTAAALTAACCRIKAEGASLGQLAYVDRQTLWLRDLPDGTPRILASAYRIGWPRISSSGRWIAVQDQKSVRLISIDGRSIRQWKAPGSTRIGPSFHWIAGRDELVVASENGESNVFSAAGDWQAPQPPPASERTQGHMRVAGVTQSGDWLLYWRANDEASTDVQADGLDLFAVRTNGGSAHKLGLKTLVYGDMIAFSPHAGFRCGDLRLRPGDLGAEIHRARRSYRQFAIRQSDHPAVDERTAPFLVAGRGPARMVRWPRCSRTQQATTVKPWTEDRSRNRP